MQLDHRVLGLVNDRFVLIPFNINTVNTNAQFGLNLQPTKEINAWQQAEQVNSTERPSVHSEEMSLSCVWAKLHQQIFRDYMQKQWN